MNRIFAIGDTNDFVDLEFGADSSQSDSGLAYVDGSHIFREDLAFGAPQESVPKTRTGTSTNFRGSRRLPINVFAFGCDGTAAPEGLSIQSTRKDGHGTTKDCVGAKVGKTIAKACRSCG
jgi:hypothetical protein